MFFSKLFSRCPHYQWHHFKTIQIKVSCCDSLNGYRLSTYNVTSSITMEVLSYPNNSRNLAEMTSNLLFNKHVRISSISQKKLQKNLQHFSWTKTKWIKQQKTYSIATFGLLIPSPILNVPHRNHSTGPTSATGQGHHSVSLDVFASTGLNRHKIEDMAYNNFCRLLTPELQLLADIFKSQNHELRIVGGAVRDILLGLKPNDVDLSTDASLQEIKALLENEDMIRIVKKGQSEKHGTVMVKVNEKQDFEISSLWPVRFNDPTDALHTKSNVAADGHHRDEFACDWLVDAAHRDFTINAMYLTLDGTLLDYHGGEQDVIRRQIRFVGNPEDKIQEMPLAILRYFRFFARINVQPDSHDIETLKAIYENREALRLEEKRRIWNELKKILTGRFVGPIITKMHELQLLSLLGFPYDYSSDNVCRFQATCARTSGLNPHPITLLVDFFDNDFEVEQFADTMSLNKEERNLLSFLVQHTKSCEVPPILQHLDHVNSLKMWEDKIIDQQWPLGKPLKVKVQVLELFKYCGHHHWILGDSWRSSLDTFRDWTPPLIPITVYDLIQVGFKDGWHYKWREFFATLTNEWKDSDYELSKDELLEIVKNNITEFNQSPHRDRTFLKGNRGKKHLNRLKLDYNTRNM